MGRHGAFGFKTRDYVRRVIVHFVTIGYLPAARRLQNAVQVLPTQANSWRDEMIGAIATRARNSVGVRWTNAAESPSERSLDAHDVLVHEGDDTRNFYEVLEGVLSSYKIFADGRRQIIAFAFAGDLIGFSHGDAYRYECEAVSAARVRIIPKTALLRSIRERPEIGEKLLALAAIEVAQVEDHSLSLGRKSALERVASFLVNLADRAGYGHVARIEMRLPMSRLDMADFLGLTIETVSRNLTRLRVLGIIELPHTSTLVIRNLDVLRDLAECEGSC
jgi:CRP-like cAMP-binding protein